MKRKQIYKLFIGFPLCLLLSLYDLISDVGDFDIVESFAYKVFGRMSFNNDGIYLLTMQNLLFVVVCNILFADSISTYFRDGCVYVFSRIHDRVKWYWKQVVYLLMQTSIYTLGYLLSTLWICARKTNQTLQTDQLYPLIIILIFSLFLSGSTTLLINLLSIRWGTTISFICVQIAVFVLIFVGMISCNVPLIVLLNPIACLNILDQPNHAIPMLATNIICMAATIKCGSVFVKKYDIYLFDAEVS